MKPPYKIAPILAGLAVAFAGIAGAVIKQDWQYPSPQSRPLHGGMNTIGYAVAVDKNGDFIVAGSQLYNLTNLIELTRTIPGTAPSPDLYRAFLVKVSAFRRSADIYPGWSRTNEGIGTTIFEDSYRSVAVAANGVDLIVGGTFGSVNLSRKGPQAVLAYYYFSGSTAWVSLPDANSVDGVAISGTSWIYAVGTRQGAAGNTDLWVGKFNYNGKFQNSYVYKNPLNCNNAARAIAVDQAGYVYVAGYRTVGINGGAGYQGKNIWLGRFTPDLALVAEKDWDGPSSSTDFASSLVLGKSGEIYLAGTQSASGTAFQDNQNLWIGRVEPSGSTYIQAWSWTIDGGERDEDAAWAMALDPSGSVWVTGSLDTPGSHWADLWVGKMSPSGELADSFLFNDTGNGDDIGRGLAFSSTGPVVCGVETDLVTRETYFVAQFLDWIPPDPNVDQSALENKKPNVNPRVTAYPNPFNPGSSGTKGGKEMVIRSFTAGSTVRLYTLSGILVRELSDDNGDGEVSWNAKNASGKDVESGVYVYIAKSANGSIKTRGKVVIIR